MTPEFSFVQLLSGGQKHCPLAEQNCQKKKIKDGKTKYFDRCYKKQLAIYKGIEYNVSKIENKITNEQCASKNPTP